MPNRIIMVNISQNAGDFFVLEKNPYFCDL
jgi:hypothetical protein